MFARLQEFTRSKAVWDRCARVAVVAGMVFLVSRHWDPYYGFTALVQADAVTESHLPPSLRDAPIFIHRDVGRYDGAYYAQIAISPALRDPALDAAVDDLGYRARRILLSVLAWVLGGGDPVSAVHAYAWLNPILWLVLVGQAWRLFPAGDRGATLAWMGVVLASGTLASVRLALTDLAALVLLAAMLPLAERGRSAGAAGLLGLAALARETALLGVIAHCPGKDENLRRWVRWAGWSSLAVLPLACWLTYLWRTTGSSGTGSSNFALPLAGWAGRIRELWHASGAESNRGLLLGGWLDHLALTVQAIYLISHPDRQNGWWKLGIAYTLLGLCLGHAVWEGFPGAASRLLLPLALAFNVLASRRRAAWLWLIAGNVSIIGGVWTFLDAPGAPHRLTSAVQGNHSYVLETDARWSVAEWNSKWRWSWSEGEGGLAFRIWPHQPKVQVELQVRGITPRELEVRHAGVTVWRGPIGDRPQWITLPELPMERGRLELELRSDTPATREGAANTARGISFACFGARMVE